MNASPSDIGNYRYDKAFTRGLRERGLEDGRNIVIVRRSADGQYERLPQLMQELVSTPVDVIVTSGAVAAARRTTRTIPIVAVGTGGLVESGAIVSLGRPGGNVTGLTGEVGEVELSTKRLQLLHDAAPRISRVAVVGYALQTLDSTQRSSFESAARTLRHTIIWAHARMPQDLKSAFATIESEQADALYIEAQAVNHRHVRDIVDVARKRKLASIYEFREGPDQGGLMSYGADLADLFSRAGSFVDRILKGAKPGDLPVEQPTRFELVLNRTAAKTLGINFSSALLQQANDLVG